jgi:hypothetical protein
MASTSGANLQGPLESFQRQAELGLPQLLASPYYLPLQRRFRKKIPGQPKRTDNCDGWRQAEKDGAQDFALKDKISCPRGDAGAHQKNCTPKKPLRGHSPCVARFHQESLHETNQISHDFGLGQISVGRSHFLA